MYALAIKKKQLGFKRIYIIYHIINSHWVCPRRSNPIMSNPILTHSYVWMQPLGHINLITGFWSKEVCKIKQGTSLFFLEKSISMIKNEQYKHSSTSHRVQDWATPLPSPPPCRINRKYSPNSNAIPPCTRVVSHGGLYQASTNPFRNDRQYRPLRSRSRVARSMIRLPR